MLFSICTTLLLLTAITNICPVSAHNGGTHPIGKLIRGTFINYDEQGEEFARLYVCKATGSRYYFTVIRTDRSGPSNYLIGNGMFSKSGIDEQDNTITNDDCYFQDLGTAAPVSSCMFDVIDLCDDGALTLSGDLQSIPAQPVSWHFVKLSNKDELLGNEQLAPYQCGIAYDGDLSQEAHPVAFRTDPVPWSGGTALDAFVFFEAEPRAWGCWANVRVANERPEGGSGVYQHLFSSWDNKLLLAKSRNYGIGDDCAVSTQIMIRVERDTMMIGYLCENGLVGAGYLAHKTDLYDSCPIFPPAPPV